MVTLWNNCHKVPGLPENPYPSLVNVYLVRLALAVLLLLPLQATAGQVELTDAEGDVAAEVVGGVSAPDAAGAYSDYDLLALRVTEEDAGFNFELELGAPSPVGQALARPVRVLVNVSYDGVPYELLFWDQTEAFWLNREPFAINEPLFVQEQGSVRVVRVPRDSVLAADGSVALPGRSLVVQDARVTANGLASIPETAFVSAVDEMVGPAELLVELGGAVFSEFRLGTSTATRVSNGAETVYVYDLSVENLNSAAETVTLAAVKLPNAWSVRFPADVLPLKGGEVRTVPVLVSVPFSHQHGSYESFSIEARRLDEDVVKAELELGVRFTQIPQPAGHHPRLWLHSFNPSGANGDPGVAFMNAVSEDPLDSQYPVRSGRCAIDGQSLRHEWVVPLNPRLQIGLDFDATGNAKLVIPFQVELDVPDALLDVSLMVGAAEVAFGESPIALVGGAVTTLSMDLPVEEVGDFIPFFRQSSMELVVGLSQPSLVPVAAYCQVNAPVLAPGGELELPLFEYHDPIPVAASGSLVSDVVAPRVAPGSRVAIEHSLIAPEQVGVDVELRVFGRGAEWVSISASALSLRAGEARNFTVLLDVPSSATNGQVIDVIVEATNGDFIAMHRLSTVVDDSVASVVDVGFESAQESPFLAAMVLAVGLLALAVQRRRRFS